MLELDHYWNSSSAVAERPRDDLRSSVVSCNEIIICAESFIIVFGATLRLLVINFVVISRHQ